MSITRRLSHLPFQTKVLLPVLAVLITLPIVTVTLVNRHVENRSLHVAEEKLAAAEAVLLNSLDIRDRAQREQFKNAVIEPRFRAVSRLNDSDTMRAYLESLLSEFGDEVRAFLYFPIDGSRPVAVQRESELDLELLQASLRRGIEAAMQGQTHTELLAYSDSAYNALSLPVALPSSEIPIGCLSIAVSLDNEAIKELKSLTHSEIILAIDSQPVGGTLPLEKARLALQAAGRTSSAPKEGVRPTLIANEHFHLLANTLPSTSYGNASLQYLLLSSYEQELLALQRTRWLLLSISLGGIAISGLIIFVFVRRITEPLRLLKEGADAVGRGDLEHKVQCDTNDECGMLARAFNHMTDNLLSSRKSLESTVAELKDTQCQLLEREARLRESEEGLRLIIEGARDHAIFTIDENGAILRWNPASERILGYASSETASLQYADLFGSDASSAQTAADLVQAARANGQATYEGWRRRKDGSLFWADVTLSLLQKASDSSNGSFVEITRDITDRKEAENAMREARDAAEASDRAKSEFLANMSHEFRTPMNGIIGMTSLLASLDLTEEQREYAETIRLSADSLLTIIDDILDIAKIEAGELEIEPTATNLLETVESALEPFQSECEKKSLELQLAVSNALPSTVETDPSRLRQVIVNMVGNALKFTREGGVTVNLNYDNTAKQICIAIEDTGIGIPEDKQERIFDPFFQVQSSASREFGGTGLGLTICRNIIRLLGGSIRVESAAGKGATFHVRIDAPIRDANPLLRAFDGLKALLLVDEPIARKALCAQLAAWSLSTDSMGSAPEPPRKAIEQGCYDLLIVDRSASRPDTMRTLFDLRAEMGDRFPPIIRLVDSKTDQTLTRGDRCALLPKPTSLLALNRQIAAFSDRSEQPPASPKVVRETATASDSETRVALPPEPPAPPQSKPAAKEDEGLFATSHPLRLLIVEDNPINTKVLVRILKKLGYAPETAENGEEGLAAAESMQFDTVLMDLQMPVMDGLECARRIVSSDSIQHPIYISAFTANARDDDRVACHEAGMQDFVAKPARIPAVEAVLERAYNWIVAKRESLS